MTQPATRRSRIVPACALLFAVVSILWFGLSFAISAQLIADGSMRDQVHLAFGYAAAAVEAATVAGWFWALYMSARTGSSVNSPVQIMCGATAAVQLATCLAMAVLMGGGLWDEPTDLLLGYAAIAALLAVLIGRFKTHMGVGRG